MKAAEAHPDEAKRLEALKSLNILDTMPEGDFDQITRIASQICDTPIALISLVDQDRQWFKSKIGLEATETSREIAFCAHAILQDEVFVVDSPREDERFHDNPLVTGPLGIQFYAGAPLYSVDGHPLGTVCVIDNKARELTPGQIAALKDLSAQATKLLQLRGQIQELEAARKAIAIREAALEASDQELRFTLDAVPHMVALWSDKFINIKANSALSDYYQKTPDQICGMHIRELLGEERYTKSLPFLEQVLAGEKVSFERRLVRNDGTSRAVLATYIPHFTESTEKGADKKVSSFLAFALDITEIRDLEKQRQSLESKLADSARLFAVEEMANGVAHEINNPLAIIKGKVANLRRRIADGNAPTDLLTRGFETIDSTVDRIAAIVTGLRTYSRNAEHDPLETVKLLSIIENTVALCREKLTSRGVEIQIDCADSLVLECRVTQISQLLMNLVTNSFEVIAESETKLIKFTGTADGEERVLRIEDSGSGISPAVAKKMMQPFFTTKEVGKGTGLGLSIARGIADAHHGRLEFIADASRTTFALRLPARQASSVV